MGLWSKGIDRSKTGKCRLEEMSDKIYDFLEGRLGIEGYAIIDLKEGIIDIDGNLELSMQDLDKDKKIPIKIRKISGDLILGSGKFHPSVLPDEIEGKIIIDCPYHFNFVQTKKIKALGLSPIQK